jgi:serine/threonine protein kinase
VVVQHARFRAHGGPDGALSPSRASGKQGTSNIPPIVGGFIVGDMLGRGGFGEVSGPVHGGTGGIAVLWLHPQRPVTWPPLERPLEPGRAVPCLMTDSAPDPGAAGCVWLQVRLGQHQLTNERVAMKFLPKSAIVASMGAAERATTEIQCLMALNHPHVIKLLQVRDLPQHGPVKGLRARGADPRRSGVVVPVFG